jgi:hypothetical protein
VVREGVLAELRQKLRTSELVSIAPVLRISESTIDARGSRLFETSDYLMCEVVSVHSERCPFEFHFGRGHNLGRFNLFIGMGAEVYNYEPFEPESLQHQVAEDMLRFLQSNVHCEKRVTKNGVARATCYLSRFHVDGRPIRFDYVNAPWPVFRYRVETVDYLPWLEV